MKERAVAVLDVGKTNKKVTLYGRKFEVFAEERNAFEPKEVEGVEVEDTEGLLQWFRGALKKLAADADIQAIAITTHGATGALLNTKGRLAFPVISYSAARGAEVQEEFYREFGSPFELHQITCTPDLGFTNLAKMFFFVKTRMPAVWSTCENALFYTSYLGYELTGEMGMEPTYLGNHSYLWNFARKNWSPVAIKMGLHMMFPEMMSNSWEPLGKIKPRLARECGLSGNCVVTQGIHDSNANYLPYLAQRERVPAFADFLLNSTGTWCVLMRQSDTLTLTREEIEQKVFFNLDALGRPIRTSIFPAGMDYDAFRAFTSEPDRGDADAVRRVVAQRNLFVIPGVLPASSPFPGAAARVVENGRSYPLEELKGLGGTPFSRLGQDYYAALNLGLALATRKLLNRSSLKFGTSVFIEGGFSRNKSYCELVAALSPEQRIKLTNVKEGTSFGAALTAWMCAEKLSLESIGREFTIETLPLPAPNFGDLKAYTEAYMKLVKG